MLSFLGGTREHLRGKEPALEADHGEPAVRLVPVGKLPPRELGHFKGLFTVPDDFDDEDPELEALFYE